MTPHYSEVFKLKLRSGLTVTLQIPGFNQVELIEELGSGGDGHVWKVKPLSPGNAAFYVLKSIRLDPEMNTEQRADHIRRIRREASVFVDSQYIIMCLGLCEAERDHFFLLFPYEPGMNLEQWIWENRDRSLSDKKALFLKILEGVQALHQAQIIHRDLKPKNILIVIPEETPRIFDFGLAKFRNRESVTEVGTIAGTDAYIAPEVFGWGGIKAVDERCDIYALGIILYELIVGKNPWRANGWDFGDFAGYLQKQNRDGGESAFHHILDIDKKFSSADGHVTNAIEHSTMFEPDHRFQNVEQLRQAIQGLRISTPPRRLLDSLPHDGDTLHLARQALSHEQDIHQDLQPSQSVAEHRDPEETETLPEKSGHASTIKSGGATSGCIWSSMIAVFLFALLLGGIGLGAWGIYHWWTDRNPLQVVATPTPTAMPASRRKTQPTPRPTSKPTARPQPTRTPTPQPTPTRTPAPQATRTSTPRPRPTATPTPYPTSTATPLPTPTPLHGLDQQALDDLQHILAVEESSSPEDAPSPKNTPSENGVSIPPENTVTPTPTLTPTATLTPTPAAAETVNPQTLEKLIRKDD